MKIVGDPIPVPDQTRNDAGAMDRVHVRSLLPRDEGDMAVSGQRGYAAGDCRASYAMPDVRPRGYGRFPNRRRGATDVDR